jgi:DNA-binding MarR family transcriptional regulator
VATKKNLEDNVPAPADPALVELVGHFGLSILRAARVLRQFGHDGISTTQNTALAMIDKAGPLTVGELAAIERIARPTASAVVNKLEELKYVRRLDDPADGRICRVELTASGRNHLKTTRTLRTDWLVDLLAGCGPAELESLQTALKLLDMISEVPDEAAAVAALKSLA